MIKQRISALLDLPQTYLMFYGNSADFFASLVVKYGSNNAETAIFNTEFNNTSVEYPVFFWKLASLHNATTKDELVDALAAQLSEEDVGAAETYMANSQNPVFPVSRLVNTHFSRHTSVAIISKTRPWLDYMSALSVVKFYRNRDQVADYHNYLHDYFSNMSGIIFPYSVEEVLDYMHEHDIERTAGFRLRILFALPLNPPTMPTISEVFDSSLSDLYNQYRYAVRVSDLNYQLRDILPINNKRTILCLEDVVANPVVFANTFNITNEDCFKEIQDWHCQNIELMESRGFTVPVKA